MKKKILMATLVVLSALGSNVLMAQDQTTPPPAGQPTAQPVQRQMPSAADRAKRQTDRLNQDVQLTPDQYAKVLQVNTDFQTQRDALSSAGPKQMTPEQREQMRTAAKDRMDKINAILTPEQQQKMQSSKTMRTAPAPAPGQAPATPENH